MEDYRIVEKTNYFKVNDVEKFKSLVDCIDEIELSENAKGEFSIAGYIDIEGYYDVNEDDILDIAPKLQKLLPDGEAVIFTCIKNRKLLSVKADARIITNKSDDIISFEDIVIKKAKERLKDNSKAIYMEY